MILSSRPLQPQEWVGLPWLLCILATLAFATPIRVMGLQAPEPVFGFAPAFAWAFIRPSILPPFALLLLGLAMDLMWGAPLGLWPLCLLSLHALVLAIRATLSGHGFLVLWGWYGSGCALALGVGFVLTALMAGAAPNLWGVGGQWLASVALYPFAYRLIDRFEDADVRFR